MATKIGLGVPMPLLAPATATWALPFGLYYIFLQNRVVYHRIKSTTAMGSSSDASLGTKDPLFIATRAQLNFAENVPLALVVALLAELNGANRRWLHGALAALWAMRVAHVELGLHVRESKGLGRIVGYYGTQSVLLGLVGYAAFLVKDYLQIAA